MYKSLTGFVVGGFIGLVASGAVGLAWTDTGRGHFGQGDNFRNLQLIANVLETIRAEYVVEIDESKAVEAGVNGMLVSLDPHSTYLDSETFKSFRETSSGQYGGLGLEVTLEDGFIKVISPMDGSPAARAGVQAGDIITGIGGQLFRSQSINDGVRAMRGEPGTEILLNILRGGDQRLDVSVTRQIINIRSVKHKIIDDAIGYVRISTFDEKTATHFKDAMGAIRSALGRNPQGIILDLRNNGGGLLHQAVAVASTFLDGGVVVSTRARRVEHDQTYSAQKGVVFSNTRIFVLINTGSASASEIVAGALQDRRRATIIGQSSFGKGSVQNLIPLGDGEQGALRLTTARYYTPSGRSIQARGIKPDLYVQQDRGVEDLPTQRWAEAALPNALDGDMLLGSEKISPTSEMPPETYTGEDYQLDRAVALIKNRSDLRNAIRAQRASLQAP